MKVSFLALLSAGLLLTGVAQSKVYHSVKDLLLSQFKESEEITFIKVQLTPGRGASLKKRLQDNSLSSKYVFNVAKSQGRIDGYSLFDKEIGQHEPIDLATFFDAQGKITRVEVVAYREAYGDGVRAKRFRRQFVGKDAGSGFTVGKDIDAVSGATISSQSMARAIKRAAVLLDETVLSPNSGK